MSDYLFMLESHLTAAQRGVVAAVEAAGAKSENQLFLVGGAMRDMLGGFPIADLDFAYQGNPTQLTRIVTKSTGATVVESDAHRKTVELRFPSGVTAEIGMCRTERFTKAGARPQVAPAGIHEDLLRRDFTMNSIALSLHPASRGLLLDPGNGSADIERRELRTNGSYSFYDDPARMLRLLRFQVRFGFAVEERTQRQYENAREAEMERRIPQRRLFRELQAISDEASPSEILAKFEEEGLLGLFLPARKGKALNLSALGKLEKAKQMVPYGVNLELENLGLFLYCMTERLTPKEESDLIKSVGMAKAEVDRWRKLEAQSRKLEKALKSTETRRTSELYQTLRAAPGAEILFLYLYSKERLVHDRIRNYLQKHLYAALEITDRDVTAFSGLEPGQPEFDATKEEMVLARLDGRKLKPRIEEEPEPPPKKPSRKPSKKAQPKKTAASAKADAKPAKKPAKDATKAPAKAAGKSPAKKPAKAAAKKPAKSSARSAAKTPAKAAKKTTSKKAPAKAAKQARKAKKKPRSKK